MKINRTKQHPSVLAHAKSDLVEEVGAWHELFLYEWRWVSLLILGLVLLLIFSKPLPPKVVYLAASQPGSTLELVAQKLVPYFKNEGIELHLVNTAGSGASLSDLADKSVAINAALVVGGVSTGKEYPNLRSLGSIEYVPLWFFYRGPEYSGKGVFNHFKDQKISIGLDNSGTQIITSKLLKLSNIDLNNYPNLLRVPNKEAAEKLVEGKIDGMLITDGPEGANVRKLLEDKNINIFDFVSARAYSMKLPFLEPVMLPKGSLNIEEDRPNRDIRMLASTINLLVEEDLHPAIQELFLTAAKEVSKEQENLFAKPGTFPAYVDRSVEISPVAKNFYEKGQSFLYDFLPFWLANYIERIWFYVFGFVAITYPLSRLFPSLRTKRSVWIVSDAYEEIQRIDLDAANAATESELAACIERLDALDRETRDIWVSSDEMNRLYTMKGAINLIRLQLYKKLESLSECTN
ncbi:MAG: TAXI family TRAP transporter solute-binding subunit [Polynucleobacter victoriensis]